MTGKYIEKLLELMTDLEKSAVQALSKSEYTNHHELLAKIKYLAGYIETLRVQVI